MRMTSTNQLERDPDMKDKQPDRLPVEQRVANVGNGGVQRRAARIAAAAVLALTATACGGGGPSGGASSPAGGTSSSPSAVVYSACMRSHGVPNYPDPDSSGRLPKTSAQQLGVGGSQYQAAQRACRHVLPIGGSFEQNFQQCVTAGDCPAALVQQALTVQRKFARCMRAHGVPKWPDPRIGPGGAPFFPVSAAGLSHQYTHSPDVTSKVQQCERVAGGSVPVLMG
jgi:hypothetical protein